MVANLPFIRILLLYFKYYRQVYVMIFQYLICKIFDASKEKVFCIER